jgi:hypothetical protein
VTNSKLIPTLYNGNRSYVNQKEVIYDPTKGFKFIIPIPLGSIRKLKCEINSPEFPIIPIEVHYKGRVQSWDKITSKDGIGIQIGISITNSHPKEGDNVSIYYTTEASFFFREVRITHKTMDSRSVSTRHWFGWKIILILFFNFIIIY